MKATTDAMDIGQTARKMGRSVKAAFLGLMRTPPTPPIKARAAAGGAAASHGHWPRWERSRASVVLIVLYYPLRACMVSDIDDDTGFWPAQVNAGQSAGVAMMAALIDREVNDHGWVVNSPGFTPTGMLLDEMPNYQRGMSPVLRASVIFWNRASATWVRFSIRIWGSPPTISITRPTSGCGTGRIRSGRRVRRAANISTRWTR